MGLINQNVNNIIFLKIKDTSKDNLDVNESLYYNIQPLPCKKDDLSFLEEDIYTENSTKFYEDLGDFAFNANSLVFDKENNLWDESMDDPDEEILFNKLETLLDRKIKLPTQDDEIGPEFFQSDYFEKIIKENHKEYYNKWIAIKEVKEKYGDSSFIYQSALETWKKDENKHKVEESAKSLVKNRIQDLWNEKNKIKTKVDRNRKTLIIKGIRSDIIATSFTPKNFYLSDSEWVSHKLSEKEIKHLINANADEYKIPKEFINDIVSVEFECCFINILRDWLHDSFLESRLWIGENIIETYPKKLLFIRNVRYSQKQNAKPDNTNFMWTAYLSPILLSPINFKTTGKNDAHKAYLSRNADKKAKTSLLKKVTPNSLKLNLQPNLNLEHNELKSRRARIGRNPLTGKIININAKKQLRLEKPNKYSISIFSKTQKPIIDTSVKLYFNNKEIEVHTRRINNILEFSIKNKNGYAMEISHKNFKTKKIDLNVSEFQKKSNIYMKNVYMEPSELVETFTLENDTFLLLGCIGKTVVKDNKPIEGIRYY